MIEWVGQFVGVFGPRFTTFFISMLPVIELRGAIPIGITLGLSPIHSASLSFLGSILPAPFILFGIRPVFDLLRQTRLFKNIVDKLTNRSLDNHSHRVQKYGVLGLITLVAIPLPGTGVWSGSLIAALLDIRFKWAFPAIILGNLISAIFIFMLSNGVLSVFSAM